MCGWSLEDTLKWGTEVISEKKGMRKLGVLSAKETDFSWDALCTVWVLWYQLKTSILKKNRTYLSYKNLGEILVLFWPL